MDSKKVGQRIKTARKKAAFTQKSLAEAIGVTASTISTIERGIRAPSLEVFVNILNTVGVSADVVLQDVLKYGFKIQSTELGRKVQDLSSEEQKRIFRMIDALMDKS